MVPWLMPSRGCYTPPPLSRDAGSLDEIREWLSITFVSIAHPFSVSPPFNLVSISPFPPFLLPADNTFSVGWRRMTSRQASTRGSSSKSNGTTVVATAASESWQVARISGTWGDRQSWAPAFLPRVQDPTLLSGLATASAPRVWAGLMHSGHVPPCDVAQDVAQDLLLALKGTVVSGVRRQSS